MTFFGHFVRGRLLKGRCNIRVYVPVNAPVSLWTAKSPPHSHMTPQPRPRIRAFKQVCDLPLGRTTPFMLKAESEEIVIKCRQVPKGPGCSKNNTTTEDIALCPPLLTMPWHILGGEKFLCKSRNWPLHRCMIVDHCAVVNSLPVKQSPNRPRLKKSKRGLWGSLQVSFRGPRRTLQKEL